MHDRAAATLERLPVSLFGAALGVTGLGLAWREAVEALGAPAAIGEAILALSALVFAAQAGAYALKFARAPDAVRAEFADPVAINFFPIAGMVILLLATAALPYSRPAAHALWLAGVIITFGLTLVIVSQWLSHRREIHHVSPAWFIPPVGNALAPVTGAALGHVELAWMLFTVGLVFWIVLLPIVLYRLMFHERLTPQLLPTMAVLFAPAAVDFNAYAGLALTDSIDPIGRVLYYASLLLTLVAATFAREYLRLKFALSWWAFTFPLDAMAIAALRYDALVARPSTAAIAAVLLALASAVVGVMAWRTLVRIARGTLLAAD